MGISFTKKVTIPEEVLFRDMEGEAVLLNLDNENYYGLNEVGTRMWEALTSSGSIQEAYDKLLEEYDTEPDKLKNDLSKLLSDLQTQGLIEISDV